MCCSDGLGKSTARDTLDDTCGVADEVYVYSRESAAEVDDESTSKHSEGDG